MPIAYMDDAGDLGALANPPLHNDQPVFALTLLVVNQVRLAALVPEFLLQNIALTQGRRSDVLGTKSDIPILQAEFEVHQRHEFFTNNYPQQGSTQRRAAG